MKKIILSGFIILSTLLGACEKTKSTDSTDSQYGNGPKTEVPASLQGTWMYGYFSLTEYWSTNPSTYIGNGFEMAIAFKFYANGTYEQYFTSKTVIAGAGTFHQSLTKGTVEIDPVNKKIITHAHSARYKRVRSGVTEEDRYLSNSEITATSSYAYTEGTEPNGTRAIYLKLNGTGTALAFLKKP